MQRVQQVYTQKYNKKNKRTGHVFGQRYKAVLCNKDVYLLHLIKYIHFNPIKADITKTLDYKWSSHREYIKDKSELVDTEFVLKIISTDKTKALRGYKEYMNEEIEDVEKAEYEIINSVEVEETEEKEMRSIEALIEEIIKKEGITNEELISKERTRKISRARKKIIMRAEKECQITKTKLAKRLNLTITAISKTKSRANKSTCQA
ncbi:MAG: hypothetical protein ACLKAK_08590 [Alkaliphilus sp.]